MDDLAILEAHDGVARLTLHRPEARNALSLELIKAVRARVRELAGQDTVRVCVVTGAGRAFCAGMDLKAILDDPDAPAALLRSIAELTIELRALPMVTVARVNGAAIGGGCGLMCVCDLALTHADAKLGYPEVDIGVCPAVVAPWLVERIGPGAARRMLLTGGLLTGAEAFERGLVTGVVATLEDLDGAVDELVGRLAGAGPRALRATKAWLNETGADAQADLVRRGALISAEVIADPAARLALKRAFGHR